MKSRSRPWRQAVFFHLAENEPIVLLPPGRHEQKLRRVSRLRHKRTNEKGPIIDVAKVYIVNLCTGSSEKKLLSCEKVLPGSAWLVLIKSSKQGLFSAQACNMDGQKCHVNRWSCYQMVFQYMKVHLGTAKNCHIN